MTGYDGNFADNNNFLLSFFIIQAEKQNAGLSVIKKVVLKEKQVWWPFKSNRL